MQSIQIKVHLNQPKHQITSQGSSTKRILNDHISRTFPSSFQISNQAIPKQPHSSHKAPGQSVTTTSQTHSPAKLPISQTQGLPTHLPLSQFHSLLDPATINQASYHPKILKPHIDLLLSSILLPHLQNDESNLLVHLSQSLEA